jgi:hypothetical protein
MMRLRRWNTAATGPKTVFTAQARSRFLAAIGTTAKNKDKRNSNDKGKSRSRFLRYAAD